MREHNREREFSCARARTRTARLLLLKIPSLNFVELIRNFRNLLLGTINLVETKIALVDTRCASTLLLASCMKISHINVAHKITAKV